MTVTKIPSEKMLMRIAFFRSGSLAQTSIGNGVHILEVRALSVRALLRRRKRRTATYIIIPNTLAKDAMLV